MRRGAETARSVKYSRCTSSCKLSSLSMTATFVAMTATSPFYLRPLPGRYHPSTSVGFFVARMQSSGFRCAKLLVQQIYPKRKRRHGCMNSNKKDHKFSEMEIFVPASFRRSVACFPFAHLPTADPRTLGFVTSRRPAFARVVSAAPDSVRGLP